MSEEDKLEMTGAQDSGGNVEAPDAAPPAPEAPAAAPAAAPADRPARTDSGPPRERGRGGRRGHHDGPGPRDREGGSGEAPARMPRFRKKVCNFCQDKNLPIDYKRSDILGRFITDRGKILPRRVTGTCARHQRIIAREIKRARIIALLPFVEQ